MAVCIRGCGHVHIRMRAQWHRAPLDPANTKDARFLYRRGCLDEERGGDGDGGMHIRMGDGGAGEGAAALPSPGAETHVAAMAAAAGAGSVTEGAAAIDRVMAEAVRPPPPID